MYPLIRDLVSQTNPLYLMICVVIFVITLYFLQSRLRKQPVKPSKEPLPLFVPTLDTSTMKSFNLNDLKKFNGEKKLRLNSAYLSIFGWVFDVSSKLEFYGPGAAYNCFVGKDSTVALAKSELDPKVVITETIADLSFDELQSVLSWFEFYRKKYPLVGFCPDTLIQGKLIAKDDKKSQ